MLDIVELGVISDGIAEIGTDGIIDGHRTGVTLLHQSLHHLQLLGRAEGRIQLNTRSGSQLDNAVLRKILNAATVVAGPLIHHSVGVVVHGGKSQLIEPTGDIALRIHVTHRLGGAHSYAQHGVVVQIHSARQCGNVTIVGYLNRDVLADLPRHVQVHIFDLFVKHFLVLHLEEQGGHHNAVVDIHARAGHADGIYTGHMGGSRLHCL